MLDSRMLKENQKFKELKDSYVIFIYKHDKFRKGLPLYHIDRYVRETNELYDDGSHIIYVNGNYKGDDEIGQLMKDFRQSNPEDMYYDTLAQGVKHFKKTEKGRDQMCEAVENYAEKKVLKSQIINVQNLMENLNLTLEQALDALKIQGDEKVYIMEQLHNK